MNAIAGLGGIKVQTMKLKRPKKKPIKVPALVPNKTAVITTGTAESVATMGPNAGSEPKGVKQKIISIANRTAN